MLPAAALMPVLFGAMKDHSPELVRMESGYAQILLAGSVVMLCARGIGHYFFGMHRPKIITMATIAGNVTNVIFNYVLIFGEAGLTAYADDGSVLFALPGVPGAPTMGVYGAAIGTIIGTGVEFAIPLAVFLSPKWNRQYRTRASWRPRWSTFREVVKLGWPCSIQWGNEIVCWSLFMSVIVGTFGEAHMAAGWIALRFMHLAFMPTVGVSTAVNSLVGKYIGAGKPDTGVARARLGLAMAVLYMTFCGAMFFLFRHSAVSLFVGGDTPPEQVREIVQIGGRIMVCAAVFQLFDAFGIIYTGALRGAGDTLWPSVATIVYSWTFIVGLGWGLAVHVPQWESLGPWIGAAVFIIFYGVTMSFRFEGGAWRKIRLVAASREESPETAPVGPVPPATSPDGAGYDLADAVEPR
jgi:MATE family multidrug resistance protein